MSSSARMSSAERPPSGSRPSNSRRTGGMIRSDPRSSRGRGARGRSASIECRLHRAACVPKYGVWPEDVGMAMSTIRSTYALDVETMQVLKRIANKWKLSKSEALRRVIRAAEGRKPRALDDALRALDRLQRSLRLTPAKAKAWARQARLDRGGSATRSEP